MLAQTTVPDAPQEAPVGSTPGDLMIYALWFAGALGVVATLAKGWISPIGDRDFAFFWVAGKLAANGHAAQAYDLSSMKSAAALYGATSIRAAFPYPPQVLLIAAPLSLLPLAGAFIVSQAISAALFYAAARSVVPDGIPRWLAILTPAALVNVVFGQTGLLFGALWLWCFRGSAVAAALLTIKPHLALPAAVEIVRKRFVVRTAVIGSSILVLSAILFGLEPWQAFLSGAATDRFSEIQRGHFVNWYVQMSTPLLGYGYVGWFAFSAAAILLLVRRFDVFTASTASFLISPYGFHYDLTVPCLGFGLQLFRHWRKMPPWQTLVCALAFLAPVLVRVGTWLVPPILLLGLYTQIAEEERWSPQ